MNRWTIAMACLGTILLAGCSVQPASTQPEGAAAVEVEPADKVIVQEAAADDPLARRFAADFIGVLDEGLKWYFTTVSDYTCTLTKTERMDADGDFGPTQKIACKAKENPFSVFTHTLENESGADRALLVSGQWGNDMLATPTGLGRLLGTVKVDTRSSSVRSRTLRFLDQFGFKRSLTQMVTAYVDARGEGILRMEVLGSERIGNRDALVFESWIIEDVPSGRFEFPHLKVWLDREWKIPIQVHMWDAADIQRGRYTFTDIKVNVGLTDADFTPKACGMKAP